MPEALTTPAAPAQTETPATMPATHAAATADNFREFRKASSAARQGKPLPEVPVSAEAASAQPAEKPDTSEAQPAAPAQPAKVSKRQQEINDYERRIAEQDQRIRALEAQVTAPARTEPAAPAQPKVPDWKRFLAMPEAPRLDWDPSTGQPFESVPDFTAAQNEFIETQRSKERSESQSRETFQRQVVEQASKFSERMHAAVAADPELLTTKIAPAFAQARPISGFVPGPNGKGAVDPHTGQPPVFENICAEAAFQSERPAELLVHLSAHPEEIARIRAMPPQWHLPALLELAAHLPTSAAPVASAPPAAKPPKTLTDERSGDLLGERAGSAPADPVMAAIVKGDFRAMRAAKRVALLASQKA